MEGLDAVLDVGGVYDPSRDRYDHHQKGFEEMFGHGFKTKLSSAGLVYKVFTFKRFSLFSRFELWAFQVCNFTCVKSGCSILGRK